VRTLSAHTGDASPNSNELNSKLNSNSIQTQTQLKFKQTFRSQIRIVRCPLAWNSARTQLNSNKRFLSKIYTACCPLASNSTQTRTQLKLKQTFRYQIRIARCPLAWNSARTQLNSNKRFRSKICTACCPLASNSNSNSASTQTNVPVSDPLSFGVSWKHSRLHLPAKPDFYTAIPESWLWQKPLKLLDYIHIA